MKIGEGVYRIDGIGGMVNAYLIEGADGLTVVDTGMPGNADKIAAFVRGTGHELSDVKRIVLTHGDPDHVGSAAALKRMTGASVAAGAADSAAIAGGPPVKQPKGAIGALFKVMSLFLRIEPVDVDTQLVEGDEIAGFRVLHVPGHTPGSLALERDGIVFSGDTLLGDKEGNLQPPRGVATLDMTAALASAERIKALKPRIVLPGHGEPVHFA